MSAPLSIIVVEPDRDRALLIVDSLREAGDYDIHVISELLHFFLFADDSNILISGPSVQCLIDTVNLEIGKAADWSIQINSH